MPELAALYALGVVLSWLLIAIFLFSWKRQRNNTKTKTLRANLRKIDLWFSEHHDKLEPWSDEAPAKEEASAFRTFLIAGLLISALSWIGLLFLSVLTISYRFLARSRLEKWLYSSRLATEGDLSEDEVREELAKSNVIALRLL